MSYRPDWSAVSDKIDRAEGNVPEATETKDTNPKDAAATNRVPLALLSPIAKAHWAAAQAAGALKYGNWNWRIAGVNADVYLSAAARHLDAWSSGEVVDPVDGTHHLGNAIACLAILLDAEAAGKLNDTRPPSVGIRSTYAFVEGVLTKLRGQYADRAPRHYTIADTVHAVADLVRRACYPIPPAKKDEPPPPAAPAVPTPCCPPPLPYYPRPGEQWGPLDVTCGASP